MSDGSIPRFLLPARQRLLLIERVWHESGQSIEENLAVVFAALAITRYRTKATGVSIKRLTRMLRPLRSDTIDVGGHHFTVETPPSTKASEILEKLPPPWGD